MRRVSAEEVQSCWAKAPEPQQMTSIVGGWQFTSERVCCSRHAEGLQVCGDAISVAHLIQVGALR